MDISKISKLTALPDKRDHSAILEPGESTTLYGGITVINHSKDVVSVEIFDHLVAQDGKCGLYISIDGQEPKPVKIGATLFVDPAPLLVHALSETLDKLSYTGE